MELIDAHCHLESEVFSEDLETVVMDAGAAGVTDMITAAWEPSVWARSKAVADRFTQVHHALGVHPCYARKAHLEALPQLDGPNAEGMVAIGEIGLDRAEGAPDFAVQQELFEAQLAIARDRALPVVIHCRRALDEVLRTLKHVGPLPRGGLMHAFPGSAEVARELIKLGFSFSMGRSLTYRPSKKRLAALEVIYPDHLLLETDAPDMPPAGTEGPNVPANLLLNLRGAEELLGDTAERIAEVTTANARRLFGLEP